MDHHRNPLTLRKVFIFWIPLAATWLMMATEGPFLAAIIARLSEPKYNLAAYGVAFSFALFVEAPIIMIMSASTALVVDRQSFIKLRNFTYVLNGMVTVAMVVFLIPPVFRLVFQRVIGLPDNVAQLTHLACLLLLPWPSAIGYRRFYQGVLIRSNLTRRVAWGTVVRLSTMATTALVCYLLHLRGAVSGALALSAGVTAEAVASKWMARSTVKRLLGNELSKKNKNPIGYRAITSFYYPLALTSVLALGVQPMVTFFMGNSRMPIESLAVLPVINSLVFIFRSLGLSYQEVSIALLGENNQGYKILRDFAVLLGMFVVTGLSLVAFTPLSRFWFHTVSGLSLELTEFASCPTKIATLLPGLMVLLSFQRSVLVNNRRTKPITFATVIEVTVVIVLLLITVEVFHMIGAIAAALALVIGRTMANGYLFIPFFKVMSHSAGLRSKA